MEECIEQGQCTGAFEDHWKNEFLPVTVPAK